MRARGLVTRVLGLVLCMTIAQPSRADESNQIKAVADACGIHAAPKHARGEQKLVACLKAQADSGHLYPSDLILALAKGLEGEGSDEEALEYLAYWYAVDLIDLEACSHGSGSAAYGRGDALVMFGKALKDPAVTPDTRRKAVRRALALEATTATKRSHYPKYCVAANGGKQAETSIDDLYVSEPVWRQRRLEALRHIEPMLLAVVGVQPALRKP